MPPLAARLRYRLPGGGLRRALDNVDRFSETTPGAHWSVDMFPSRSQPWIPGSRVCPLGSRTRGEHVGRRPGDGFDVSTVIPFDDEYFEWTDILEAVLEAGETFTFLEIGAGYGRWTSRAAAAARMKDKQFRTAMAEADPRNAQWARDHMADNDIADYLLFEAAVGADRKRSMLSVGQPPDEEAPGTWYGQSIGWGDLPTAAAAGEYCGKPVVEINGWRFIEVDEIPMGDVIAPFDLIDLIDLDIQGSEAVAIRSCLDALTATTRRLHIETHNKDVEVDLRASLSAAGWRCLRDYPCLQKHHTPFGDCYMVGGVQSWINPALTGRPR